RHGHGSRVGVVAFIDYLDGATAERNPGARAAPLKSAEGGQSGGCVQRVALSSRNRQQCADSVDSEMQTGRLQPEMCVASKHLRFNTHALGRILKRDEACVGSRVPSEGQNTADICLFGASAQPLRIWAVCGQHSRTARNDTFEDFRLCVCNSLAGSE